MQHVEQETARESAEHEKRIHQWNKRQKATAKVREGGDTQMQKVDEKSTGTPTAAVDGHWHREECYRYSHIANGACRNRFRYGHVIDGGQRKRHHPVYNR